MFHVPKQIRIDYALVSSYAGNPNATLLYWSCSKANSRMQCFESLHSNKSSFRTFIRTTHNPHRKKQTRFNHSISTSYSKLLELRFARRQRRRRRWISEHKTSIPRCLVMRKKALLLPVSDRSFLPLRECTYTHIGEQRRATPPSGKEGRQNRNDAKKGKFCMIQWVSNTARHQPSTWVSPVRRSGRLACICITIKLR